MVRKVCSRRPAVSSKYSFAVIWKDMFLVDVGQLCEWAQTANPANMILHISQCATNELLLNRSWYVPTCTQTTCPLQIPTSFPITNSSCKPTFSNRDHRSATRESCANKAGQAYTYDYSQCKVDTCGNPAQFPAPNHEDELPPPFRHSLEGVRFLWELGGQ